MISIVAVTLDCVYKIETYLNYNGKALTPNFYFCNGATPLKDCDTSDDIVGVSNNHLPGKTNLDVKMISFVPYRTLDRFPMKLAKHFPNLEVLRIPVTRLTHIDKEHLRGLKNLRIFYLGYNKLTSLDGDLFLYTPNIEYFAFNQNPLSHIGHGLLDNLPHLRILHGEPKCGVDNVWDGNQAKIEEFKRILAKSCPPTRKMIDKAKEEEMIIDPWYDEKEQEEVKIVSPMQDDDRVDNQCHLKYGL